MSNYKTTCTFIKLVRKSYFHCKSMSSCEILKIYFLMGTINLGNGLFSGKWFNTFSKVDFVNKFSSKDLAQELKT